MCTHANARPFFLIPHLSLLYNLIKHYLIRDANTHKVTHLAFAKTKKHFCGFFLDLFIANVYSPGKKY